VGAGTGAGGGAGPELAQRAKQMAAGLAGARGLLWETAGARKARA
jgi:hypothetical protein